MAPEDVYNMDETALFYCAQPNKTLAQGKVRGCKIQTDHLTLTLVVNTTMIDATGASRYNAQANSKGHFTHVTESPRPLHFKHSHWRKGWSRPSSLHTTLEGRTEYVNARWM